MIERYYESAVDAAYMAFHFGVSYHTGGGDFAEIRVSATGALEPLKIDHCGLNKERWYIYPGCRNIFEPKPADKVILKDATLGEVMEYEHHSGKSAVRWGFKDSDGFTHIRMRMIEDIAEIIYRGSKPFIMPKICQ